jgi:hypothetical protein
MRKTFFKPKKGKKKIHFGEVTRFEINQKNSAKTIEYFKKTYLFPTYNDRA